MKIAEKFMKLTFIILLLFTQTGCWDNYDVTELALVSAVAVDLTNNGDIMLTVQILIPGAAQSATEGSTGKKAYLTYTVTGSTLNEAHKKALMAISRRPFYGHIQAIVFGDSLAKKGILEALDLFDRRYEFNQNVKMFIARDMEAKVVLEAGSELESLPITHFVDILNNNKLVGNSIDLPLHKLLNIINDEGEDLAISTIIQKSQIEKPQIKDLNIEGAGIFKGEKLVSYIDLDQTRSLLFVIDKITETLITIPNPANPESLMSIEIFRSKTKQSVEIKEGFVRGKVNINSIARIGEIHDNFKGSEPEIAAIEKAVTEYVVSQVSTLIATVQENHQTDIFGFGNMVYRKENKFWKNMDGDWSYYFEQMPIDVTAKIIFKNTGLITEPSMDKE